MQVLSYSRNALLDLNQRSYKVGFPLQSQRNIIADLGIQKQEVDDRHIPVMVGNRPSKKKQEHRVKTQIHVHVDENVECMKQIPVRNTSVARNSRQTNRGQTKQNLTQIRLDSLISHKSLRIATLNARSVRTKTGYIPDFIIDQNLDILGITESWLRPDEDHIVGDILPEGYSYRSVPRATGNGGGVLLVYKSNFNIKFEDYNFSSFEQICCSIRLKNRKLQFSFYIGLHQTRKMNLQSISSLQNLVLLQLI